MMLIIALAVCGQVPITFSYVYDDTGQLVKVIDSTGVIIEYVYDPVGNMLEIKRTVGAPPASLSIFDFSPRQGSGLSTVVIQGQGFSTTPANNIVRFNGSAAVVISATANQLVVTVPTGATTGALTVTVGANSATAPTSFAISPIPVITSINRRFAAPGTTIGNLQVTGINLTGATIAFFPVFNPAAVSVGPVVVNPTGTLATLSITVSPSAAGTLTAVATNGFGSSSFFPSLANSLTVVTVTNPNLDSDGDGLADALEVRLGTDPYNQDTDGDGFSDLAEVAAGSDPLNPACTPVNCRAAGSVESSGFSAMNLVRPSGRFVEADSLAFSLFNRTLPAGRSMEADSLPISVFNRMFPAGESRQAESVPFSVKNTAVGALRTRQPKQSPPAVTTTTERGRPGSSAETSATGSSLLDSDGDGLSDQEERALGTDPFRPDSDWDGYPDGLEVALGSDPLDGASIPDIRPPNSIVVPILRSGTRLANSPQAIAPKRKGIGDEHVVQAISPSRTSHRRGASD
jgi:YD repeat-containing protein